MDMLMSDGKLVPPVQLLTCTCCNDAACAAGTASTPSAPTQRAPRVLFRVMAGITPIAREGRFSRPGPEGSTTGQRPRARLPHPSVTVQEYGSPSFGNGEACHAHASHDVAWFQHLRFERPRSRHTSDFYLCRCGAHSWSLH